MTIEKEARSNSVNVVVHCWAKHLPEYAKALTIQGYSLVNSLFYRLREELVPPLKITWTVCLDPFDENTVQAIDKVLKYVDLTLGETDLFQVFPMCLNRGDLFRRAIGRNAAVEINRDSVIWFTDADYFVGSQAIEAIAQHFNGPSRIGNQGLIHPANVWINHDHARGQMMLQGEGYSLISLSHIGFPAPSEQGNASRDKLFFQRPQKICIGGVQIVDSQTASQGGYLAGTRWQKPVDPAAGFRSCRCDKAFRKQILQQTGQTSRPITIPDVYRIRHTTAGRDLDGAGNHQGKAAW